MAGTADDGAGRAARFAAVAAIGALALACPRPEAVTRAGWIALAVFAATIASFLIRPLPMGPMVLIALVALAASGAVPLKQIFQGYGDDTVWLVVAAFLIAGAVKRTGFGRRVALGLVVKLGRSMRGLGYAIGLTELVLGAVVPSNTARGGGILAPIVHALAGALGSTPHVNPKRAGAYLALVGAHMNLVAAAAFLTGMAANPLLSQAARAVFGVDWGFGRWALGALVPAALSLAVVPALIYRLAPPTLADAVAARQSAQSELGRMGPWSPGEKAMAAVFALLFSLWVTSAWHALSAALVAWLGVVLLLAAGVERWDEAVADPAPWDALIWLGGLVAMADALKREGVVAWFADTVGGGLGGVAGLGAALLLGLVYFFSMYGFSMLTAHIAAFAGAFLAVAHAAGAPPLATVALFAYLSNLCGALTTYSSGPIVIYFGLGYVPAARWFQIGLAVGLCHLAVWIGAGLVWWKLLGWW
jgi:DASS family divalent anion:Na+ symporter